jgi:hypothetical protein
MLTTCQRTTLYWLVLIVKRKVQRLQKFKNAKAKLKLKLTFSRLMTYTYVVPQR